MRLEPYTASRDSSDMSSNKLAPTNTSSDTAAPTSIHSNFSRSEHLQAEWDRLLAALQQVDASDPSASSRRKSLQAQLDDVKNEMATLLSHTKTLMPGSNGGTSTSSLPPVVALDDADDDDDDENDLAQAFVHAQSSNKDAISPQPSSNQAPAANLQYSARRRHIVKRTYDSSDDDEAMMNFNLSNDPKQSDSKIIIVEKTSARSTLAASLKRGLRNTFRSPTTSAGSNSVKRNSISSSQGSDIVADKEKLRVRSTPSPPPEAPTPPSSLPDSDAALDELDAADAADDDDVRELTEEEREALALEQSRLERESRRLRRKPDRSKHDDNRLLDIATRLSKLSSTLADNVSSRNGAALVGKSFVPKTPRGHKPGGNHHLHHTLVSPIDKTLADDEDKLDDLSTPPILSVSALKQQAHNPNDSLKGLDVSPMSDTHKSSATKSASFHPNKAPPSKHKKTWMASFQAVRSLGRVVLSEGLGRKPSAGGNAPSSSSNLKHSAGTSHKDTAASTASASQVYNELGARLNERGQKLQQTANASDRMKKDAGDLASAARALRQRQQNKGFFG